MSLENWQACQWSAYRLCDLLEYVTAACGIGMLHHGIGEAASQPAVNSFNDCKAFAGCSAWEAQQQQAHTSAGQVGTADRTRAAKARPHGCELLAQEVLGLWHA